MKKLLIMFLILFTFSNTASAGFFGDIFKELFGDGFKKPTTAEHGDVNSVRCMVEYTQLDLATGLEKNVKYTDQYILLVMVAGTDILYLMAQDLTDKINIWLKESPNNFISDLTIINCKERRLYINKFVAYINEQRWGEYKSCPDEYNVKLIDFLDYPEQWGYNVHKDRLIKDYKDGCKNYIKTDENRIGS
jgi:hypothetical protein